MDGELAVFDSTTIWEYLEDAYADTPLTPASAQARAVCRMWEDRADSAMAQHITTLIREGFMQPDGSGDLQALADSAAALTAYYRDLDARLSTQDYLCNDYSIADIATFMCLTFARTLGAPVPADLEALTAWYLRVGARPVVAAEIEEILAGATNV